MNTSSFQAPVVPPRPFTLSTTPPPQRTTTETPPRRLRQSRTPPPRSSALIAPPSAHSSQSRTPPPRPSSPPSSRQSFKSRTHPPRPLASHTSSSRHSTPSRNTAQRTSLAQRHSVPNTSTHALTLQQEDIAPPPVPTRWDICPYHTGQKYTSICLTCVKFLCSKCLLSEIYYHNQCSVAYLGENVQQSCQELKDTVFENMEKVNKTLTKFQTSLCKKRDRMLKKKNETISEIKHYYSKLRKLILSKLQKDEEKLLKLTKGKVDDQDASILEKIQQCCAAAGTLQDKHALIQNHEQLCSSLSDRSSMEYVKELVNASNYLRECENVVREVAAVRDAFLVIRFFVNSETEQTILNSNVACVEVLNSQSENGSGETLESERINEAARLQATSNDSMNTSSSQEDIIERMNENDELRVTLPPLNEQALANDTERQNIEEDSILVQTHIEEDERHGNEGIISTEISELINEFDTRLANRSNETEETLNVGELTNEMILSTLQTDPAPIAEQEDATIATTDQQITSDAPVECRENIQNEVEEESSVTRESENVDTREPGTDRRQSIAVTITTEPASRVDNIPAQDDDPPPPYPGVTSAPEPPGPDELPPPYPGTGPPPPYSQMPEAQQPPGRSRLHVESGRQSNISPRHFSDSDLQSRANEIEPPSQTSTPRLSRPKVTKVFSVNEANDRRVSGIFAFTSVRGKAFLIVDRWNKKLKYFSTGGASFGGLIFREEPWDITDMSEDLVAVTVPKLQTFYKIKVTDNSVITTSTISTPRSYACIAFNKVTQLFICGQVPQFGEPVIDIIGINGGQIIQSFRTGFNNELQFSYPRYVKVTEEGTAIVCDWNLRCLIVFKLDGSVVGKYRGTVEFPLMEPTGIAYNEENKEIYVIDAKHNSTLGAIHILNLNCRCKEIVRWDNEFRVARAIAPHANGYALGNKSGVLSIFTPRQRR